MISWRKPGTSLPMSTMTADKRAATTAVFDDGVHCDEARLVGSSMRGWVYRSTQGSIWYRLIPVEEAPLAWRHALRRPPVVGDESIVRAERDWHQTVDGTPRLVIAYRAEGQSVAECLDDSDPGARLRGVVACLRALPTWWKSVGSPLWTLPADVILTASQSARLLWMPSGQLPDTRSVFADPQRAIFLPPEVMRSATDISWDVKTWEAVDRYASGVVLVACYYQLPAELDAERAMWHAATGSAVARLPARADLPFWLERFGDHRNTVALIRRLTSTSLSSRLNVDLPALAGRMERMLELLDPRAAVAWLRDRTQPREALVLVQDLLASMARASAFDPVVHYDLLCLAGDICARYLRQPLDAIDYYERAVMLDARRPEAYREQLRIVAGARLQIALASLIESSSTVATDADVKLWRDYRYCAGERTWHGETEEEELDDGMVARYLLWRRQFVVARDFIFPRLTDKSGTYIWWDFGLGLAYVEAFLGLETGDGTNLARAAEQLQQIKNGLLVAEGNAAIDPARVHHYGGEVADLEYRIVRARAGLRPNQPGVSAS